MGRVGIARRACAVACSLVFLLAWSGLPATTSSSITASAVQDTFGRVPILAYHNVDYSGSEYSVTPEQLDEHCRWLVENGYSAITLGQFWEAATGYGKLPPNPVLAHQRRWLVQRPDLRRNPRTARHGR